MPVWWLAANAVLLTTMSVIMLIEGQPWDTTLCWKLVVAGLIATGAQYAALDTLRRASSASRDERHIYLESIFGLEHARTNSTGGNGSGGGSGGNMALLSDDRLIGSLNDGSGDAGTDDESRESTRRSRGFTWSRPEEGEPEWITRLRTKVTGAKVLWANKLESMGNSLHTLAVNIQSNFDGNGNASHNGSSQQISDNDSIIAALLSLFSAENNRTVTDCLDLLDSHDEATLRYESTD